MLGEELFYPWGQLWATAGYADLQRFAGLREVEPYGNGLYPTWFRIQASAQGRWLSPDPLAGSILNPQSLNRYAYVLNNPTSLIDPLGLKLCIPAGMNAHGSSVKNCPIYPSFLDNFDFVFMTSCKGGKCGTGIDPGPLGFPYGAINPGSTPAPMPPPTKPKPLDISKTWQRTLACGQNATDLMSTLQSDFSRFADNPVGPLTADFSPGPIVKGGEVDIYPGMLTEDGNIAVTDLQVTVSSQTSNSWTFTTVPGHHFFNGTVSFMASDAGSGSVNFVVTVNADYASRFAWAFGSVIKAGENSTRNNLLNNIQSYCASGGVQ